MLIKSEMRHLKAYPYFLLNSQLGKFVKSKDKLVNLSCQLRHSWFVYLHLINVIDPL